MILFRLLRRRDRLRFRCVRLNKLFSLDPNNEAAKKNEEFYRFYLKENIERWLTEEQWDYAEAKKYLDNFQIGHFVQSCVNSTKLV